MTICCGLNFTTVAVVTKLFRSLRIDVVVEPMGLFADLHEEESNQYPDILLGNPRGFGRQVIIDIAVTGVDGQSRTSDEAIERQLKARHD